MGDSATGGVIIEETTDGAIGGGGCRYEWNCTNWSECLPSGKQTRNCTNVGTCPDTYKTPEMEQNCTYTFEGEIIWKEILDKNKILIFSIAFLITLFIFFYVNKDYFRKLIK